VATSGFAELSSVSGAIGLAGAAANATDMPNAPSGSSAARALSVRRGVLMGAYDALKEENATTCSHRPPAFQPSAFTIALRESESSADLYLVRLRQVWGGIRE
jgi:hypothetical protein